MLIYIITWKIPHCYPTIEYYYHVITKAYFNKKY